MRTALLVTDVLAGFGLVMLVLAGPGIMAPAGVVFPLVLCASGLVLGVVLRFFIGGEKVRPDKPSAR